MDSNSRTSLKKKDDEGNTIEWVTYYYTKEWVTSPIISTFYDQPFAHHNPLRQPFPSKFWQTESVQAGNYSLNQDIVSSLKSFRTYHLSNHDINYYSGSFAYQQKFYYVGGGYFYSAYEESGPTSTARLIGEFLEGSLLDFQLVDFFPQCTAGDVRVHFQVADPHSVSVLGKQIDEIGNVGIWQSSRGFNVGYLYDGYNSVDEILQQELSNQHWIVLILRFVVSLLLFLVVWFHTYWSPHFKPVFTFSLSLITSFFALTFLVLYPFSLLSGIAFVFGLTGMYLIFPSVFLKYENEKRF